MVSSNNNEVISKAKPHTVKKFDLIKRYIEAWAQKLLNNQRCNGIIFIDCMCNSGVYTDINDEIVYGTPVRVAEVLTKAAEQYPHKSIQMYFNDYSQPKIDLLKKTIAEKTPQGLSNVSINYSTIDGNQLLRNMSRKLNVGNQLHYFLLYDPYQAAIDWEALAPYFRYWGEVMINHMGLDTIRAISQVTRPEARQKYEDTYLIDDFEKLIPYGTNKEAYEQRVAEIIDSLSRCSGRRYYVAAFPFFNRNNSWQYDLIHCTGNVEGYKLYKNSAWKVFGDKSSTKNSHVDQNQLVLDFEGLGTTTQTDEECLTVKDIAKYLQRKFAGQKSVLLDTVWEVLAEHPIFPSEGYRNEIKKELRETYGADTKTKSVITFADRGL